MLEKEEKTNWLTDILMAAKNCGCNHKTSFRELFDSISLQRTLHNFPTCDRTTWSVILQTDDQISRSNFRAMFRQKVSSQDILKNFENYGYPFQPLIVIGPTLSRPKLQGLESGPSVQ